MQTEPVTPWACKKCACTVRHKGGKCRDCMNAYAAAYREANKDKVAAANAAYRAMNRDSAAERTRAWRKENDEYAREFDRARYERDREERLAKVKEHYAANAPAIRARVTARRHADPEKQRAIHRAYRQRHLDERRTSERNKRARRMAAPGKLSPGLAERLFKLQRGLCPCCRQPLGTTYHMDHVIPLASGGTNTDDNIQLLRNECNQQKSAKHPIDFMQSRGFLL